MNQTKGRTSIAAMAALLALLFAYACTVASPESRVRAKIASAPFSQLADASQSLEPHQACDALAYDLAAEFLVALKRSVPGKKIAKLNNIEVYTHGTGDVHRPAHAHVRGKGPHTRIGPKGYPLKGEPLLSPQQAKVVKQYRKEIRKEVNRIGRAHKAND